ncbi:hypothetical protein MIB40_12460 [Aestuariirhabdus sp. Z083]|nr:hypothetical protein [Aestuariirhabdus haliotis]
MMDQRYDLNFTGVGVQCAKFCAIILAKTFSKQEINDPTRHHIRLPALQSRSQGRCFP